MKRARGNLISQAPHTFSLVLVEMTVLSLNVGEPDNGNQNCGFIKSNGKWADAGCDIEKRFLCQVEGT